MRPNKTNQYRGELGEKYFYLHPDLCEMDYIVLDIQSRSPPLAQYNGIIAEEMINHGTHEIVFNNRVVVILKNIKLGEDCIDERILE